MNSSQNSPCLEKHIETDLEFLANVRKHGKYLTTTSFANVFPNYFHFFQDGREKGLVESYESEKEDGIWHMRLTPLGDEYLNDRLPAIQ